MNNIEPKWTGWPFARGAWVGFVLGALIPCALMFPEFAKRSAWARGGGGGESAVWTEPLFYMVILGLQSGLIGAVVGVLLIAVIRVIRWIFKHK